MGCTVWHSAVVPWTLTVWCLPTCCKGALGCALLAANASCCVTPTRRPCVQSATLFHQVLSGLLGLLLFLLVAKGAKQLFVTSKQGSQPATSLRQNRQGLKRSGRCFCIASATQQGLGRRQQTQRPSHMICVQPTLHATRSAQRRTDLTWWQSTASCKPTSFVSL
jgi:hypothetical protein